MQKNGMSDSYRQGEVDARIVATFVSAHIPLPTLTTSLRAYVSSILSHPPSSTHNTSHTPIITSLDAKSMAEMASMFSEVTSGDIRYE